MTSYTKRSTDPEELKTQTTVSVSDLGLVYIGEEKLTSTSPNAQVHDREGMFYTTEQAFFIYQSLGKIVGMKNSIALIDVSYEKRVEDFLLDISPSAVAVVGPSVSRMMAEVAQETRASVEAEQPVQRKSFMSLVTAIRASIESNDAKREALIRSLNPGEWSDLEELANRLEDLAAKV